MVQSEEIYYLDTSALVKRYVMEPGTKLVDKIFKDAYLGILTLSFSYWNIGEAAVVFDKYGRRLRLNSRELLRNLMREIKTLVRLHKLVLVGISPSILRHAIKLVLRHHIYIADALQIASALQTRSTIFVSSDKSLAQKAQKEGLKILLIE